MTVLEFLSDYTFRTILLGSVVLGSVSGVLGCMAVLRRQGLVGDALAHAALPGVASAFLLTGTRAHGTLMMGAAISGAVGLLIGHFVVRMTKTDVGTMLGVILTSLFGLGVVLLTVIQKSADGSQAGIDKFLFGQAAAMVSEQVWLMAILGGVAVGILFLFLKEIKVATFDPTFAESLGIPTGRLSLLVTGLILVAIVIGLNCVGVILMSAMLVAPAAAARQWTDRLPSMIAVSAGFGVLAGAAGVVASVLDSGLPTGPMIVIFLSLIVAVSLLFGSAGGIVTRHIRQRRLAA